MKTREKKIELGQECVDLVTGFKGTATSIVRYLHGCDRVALQPKVDKKGKAVANETFDETQLAITDHNRAVIKEMAIATVDLGDKVKDPLSGFEGIVFGHAYWLNGCIRTGVSPKLDKDGKIQETQWFDDPQLELIKKKKVKKGKGDTGGPGHKMDRGNSMDRR